MKQVIDGIKAKIDISINNPNVSYVFLSPDKMIPKSTIDTFAESLEKGDAKEVLQRELHVMQTTNQRGIAMITSGTLHHHLNGTAAEYLCGQLSEHWMEHTNPAIIALLSETESDALEEEPDAEEAEESEETETID